VYDAEGAQVEPLQDRQGQNSVTGVVFLTVPFLVKEGYYADGGMRICVMCASFTLKACTHIGIPPSA
jgi:hypothetical protein